jgi:hypothetical protein
MNETLMMVIGDIKNNLSSFKLHVAHKFLVDDIKWVHAKRLYDPRILKY